MTEPQTAPPSVEDLALTWEERRDAGAPVTAAELCQAWPALLPALEERIKALSETRWLTRPAPVLGTAPIPGYELVRRLGRGGFGEVWQAVGPTGESVALKLVPVHGPEAGYEAKALQSIEGLRHPNLLAVAGVWHTPDYLVLALELADRTLWDRLQECTTAGLPGVPREELLKLMSEAAAGLDFLNSQGIQHRDVKPQNLLLVGGRVKVGDFGLVRVLAHSLTGHTGTFTLAYAAPEFFRGRTSRYSDQYSLAVTYCHLRGGRLPFVGTAAEVMHRHLHGRPDLSMLPPAERPAVARALAKRPSDRWPTCAAFIAAVAAERRDPRVTRRRLLAGAAVVGGAMATGSWWLKRTPPSLQLVRRMPMPTDLPPTLRPVRRLAVARHRSYRDRYWLFSNGPGGPILWDAAEGRLLRRFPTPCMGIGAALPGLEKLWGVTSFDNQDREKGPTRQGEVIVWDLEQGKELRRCVGHTSAVNGVDITADTRLFVTASCDDTVRVWDAETGHQRQEFKGHAQFALDAKFLPNGRQVVSVDGAGVLRLWDLNSGELAWRREHHSAALWCVAASPDGKLIASAGDDLEIVVCEAATGDVVHRLRGHRGRIMDLAFHNDRLASACHDETMRLWRVADGLETFRMKHDSAVQAVTVPTNGANHFFTGTNVDICQWEPPD